MLFNWVCKRFSLAIDYVLIMCRILFGWKWNTAQNWYNPKSLTAKAPEKWWGRRCRRLLAFLIIGFWSLFRGELSVQLPEVCSLGPPGTLPASLPFITCTISPGITWDFRQRMKCHEQRDGRKTFENCTHKDEINAGVQKSGRVTYPWIHQNNWGGMWTPEIYKNTEPQEVWLDV